MKKWIWGSVLLLLLIAGGTAYWGYSSYSSYLNPKPEPITIPKEQRFFQDDPSSLDWLNNDSSSTKKSPQQEKGTGNPSGSTGIKESTQSTPSSSDKSIVMQSQTGQGTTTDSSLNQDPVQQIKQKYLIRFEQMELSYEGEIKGLINDAKTDYVNMKSGKSNTSAIALMSKYMSKSKDLEAQADQQFYDVLGQMKQELEAKGLPTDMVNEAKVEYEERKKLQRAALIQKFMPKL